MEFIYTGPFDEVEVPALGCSVKQGETVDVPAHLVGRAASVVQDDDGNDVVDLGEGFLAQPSNWEPASGADPRTIAQLKAYAAEKGIDLGAATKKSEIVAVIRTAENEES